VVDLGSRAVDKPMAQAFFCFLYGLLLTWIESANPSLSTVRNADKIVVLGSPEGTSTQLSGSVVLEQGSHDELMKLKKGFYKALVGTGAKTSGLVDDTLTLDDTTDTGSEASALKNKADAALELQSAASSDGDGAEKEKEGGGMFGLFGKKDPEAAAKEAEEKKRLAASKARVWTYTRPELGWIIFGSCASVIKGTLLPVCGLLEQNLVACFSFDHLLEYCKLL